ncbi:MAG: M48 family metallopeptidase [Candidatus Marinimicrobia bacterium]|nr:M48 family metallopeptidase [Candidatus Neomarinimicrobiota bacterium]
MRFFSQTKSGKTPRLQTFDHPDFGSIKLLERPKIRSITISVTPFQGVRVLLRPGISRKEVDVIIRKKCAWIQKALFRAQEIEQRSRQFFSAQTDISSSEIKSSLVDRVSVLAEQYGFSYNKISIRHQRSRWGSCSAKNNISLNHKLFFLPTELSDYVLLHELAHTKQKNHGPQFWEILYGILGKEMVRQYRKKIREFEYLLYPPSQQ